MELRNDALRKHIWQGIDLGDMLDGSLKLFGNILENPKYHKSHLLHRQCFKSILLLSDLFSYSQFEWMVELFQKHYEMDQIEDFLIKQYLVLGICKVITFVFTL